MPNKTPQKRGHRVHNQIQPKAADRKKQRPEGSKSPREGRRPSHTQQAPITTCHCDRSQLERRENWRSGAIYAQRDTPNVQHKPSHTIETAASGRRLKNPSLRRRKAAPKNTQEKVADLLIHSKIPPKKVADRKTQRPEGSKSPREGRRPSHTQQAPTTYCTISFWL